MARYQARCCSRGCSRRFRYYTHHPHRPVVHTVRNKPGCHNIRPNTGLPNTVHPRIPQIRFLGRIRIQTRHKNRPPRTGHTQTGTDRRTHSVRIHTQSRAHIHNLYIRNLRIPRLPLRCGCSRSLSNSWSPLLTWLNFESRSRSFPCSSRTWLRFASPSWLFPCSSLRLMRRLYSNHRMMAVP